MREQLYKGILDQIFQEDNKLYIDDRSHLFETILFIPISLGIWLEGREKIQELAFLFPLLTIWCILSLFRKNRILIDYQEGIIYKQYVFVNSKSITLKQRTITKDVWLALDSYYDENTLKYRGIEVYDTKKRKRLLVIKLDFVNLEKIKTVMKVIKKGTGVSIDLSETKQ